MTLLTIGELTARVETPVKAADLQDLLDRIEAEIIEVAGNPYVDAETTISETHAGYGRDLFLARPILSVETVTEYSDLTDSTGRELTENSDFAVWSKEGRLQRLTSAGKWGAKVTVEYVPRDDRGKWKEAEIDLARLYLKRTAMKTESITTERSFSRVFTAPDWEAEKQAIIGRLLFARVA